MPKPIGVVVRALDPKTGLADPRATVAEIRRMEDMGISAVWLTTGGGGGDAVTIFATAAVRTKRILMGTAIAHNWAKHPVALAGEAQVLEAFAPGRLRLGIGTSAQRLMERTYGAQWNPPLGHLREYVQILRTLLHEGSVDFSGQYYRARAKAPQPLKVPVMISALRAHSFELAGAETDGAITWVCPHRYIRDVALPAMRRAAAQVNRPVPALVVHVPVCVHDSPQEARAALKEQLGYYPPTPVYSAMFRDAGFPGAETTNWTDAMADAVMVHGSEEQVVKGLDGIFKYGATEILADVITAGPDKKASAERTLRLLSKVASP